MSRYAQFDTDGNQYQIASDLGWTQFGDWVDSLDLETYPELVQLFEHGISESIQDVTSQLECALSENAPSKDVEGISELLLRGLHENSEADSVLIAA